MSDDHAGGGAPSPTDTDAPAPGSDAAGASAQVAPSASTETSAQVTPSASTETSALVRVSAPTGSALVPVVPEGDALAVGSGGNVEVDEAAPPDGPATEDPFPREAWSTLIGHAAGYLRLTAALLRDPAVSKHRRAALLAAAAYFASPIDLIPGIVPILGQIDDLAVAMLAIRLALNALEPSRRQQHLAAAGLSDETLHEDIVASGRIAAWAARAGARTGLRIGRGALRFTVRTGRSAAEMAARGGRAAVRRAGPIAERSTGVAVHAADRATSVGRGVAGHAADRATSVGRDVAGQAAGRATSVGRGLADRIRRRDPGSPGEPSDPVE